MIWSMCGIKVTDRFTCSELREREKRGIDDIITVLQLHKVKMVWACFKKGRE